MPSPKLQVASKLGSNGCIGMWVTFVFVRAMSSPTDLPAKCFELLSEFQGLALKLWANPECKAMFHRGLESMYHVTAESQGLSWELKVAAQERQKLFLQELEGRLIAPPPPPPAPPPLAASGRRNKRKGTASANSPISVPSAQHAVPSTSEENSPISEPNPNRKKMRYRVAIPSTRKGNSSIPVPLDSVPPGMRALQLWLKKMELCGVCAYKFNRLFQFCNWYMLESEYTGFDFVKTGSCWAGRNR